MSLPEWSDPERRDEALARVAARLAMPDRLAKFEVAVLFLDSHGVPQELEAAWLHLSPTTVTQYRRLARRKLFADTTPHAVATALRLGLFE